jgi:multicomponent Na+:H+ antiporter subunit E
MMILLLLNLLLALAWVALTGEFSPANFVIGFLFGYVSLLMTQRLRGNITYFKKVRRVIGFTFFFLWEVIKANLRVAYDVLSPRQRITPAILAIPLEAKTDAEITFLANLITLTPGTLSLDVSSDRKVLYVHAMYVEDLDGFRHRIKDGLERRLLDVLR